MHPFAATAAVAAVPRAADGVTTGRLHPPPQPLRLAHPVGGSGGRGFVRPFVRTGLAFRKLNSRTAAARSSVWGLRRTDGRRGDGGDAAAAVDRFANGRREGGREGRAGRVKS